MSIKSTRYDRVTIWFHWITVVLVVLQWLGGQSIDLLFSRGEPRIAPRSVHICLGICLALVIIARLAWRLTRGRRLPPAEKGVWHIAAKATHWGLYALLIATIGIGLFLPWVRGDSVFGLFRIPAFDPGNRALASTLEHRHAFLANLVIYVAGFHALAALVHRYVWRDGVLARMVTWRRIAPLP